MARTNNLTNFLNDVSSAIKQKTGDNTPIPASEFDTEILSIETAGTYQTKSVTITENTTTTITPDTGYDAIEQLTITTNVPMSQLQSKSVTITSNGNIAVLPDTNYDGMTQVNLRVNVDTNTVNYQTYTAAYIGQNNMIQRNESLYPTYKQIEIDLLPYINRTIIITNTGDRNFYGFTATKPETGTPLNAERQSTSGGLTYKYTGGNDRYLVYDFTTSNQSDTVIRVERTTVDLIEKNITTNGVYNAEDDDADGFSKVTVNVPSGSTDSLNVFVQENEPTGKNGIWLETNKEYEEIIEDRSIYASEEWNIDKMSDLTNIPYSFYRGSAVAIGTDVYLFGGSGNSTYAYKYNSLTDTYTQLTNIPYQFYQGSAVAVGTDVYLLGGTGNNTCAYKYNTLTDTYTQLTNIPYPFYLSSAVVVGTDVYLFGSAYNGSYNKYAYKYNTLTNTYTRLTDVPYPFYSGSVVAVGTDVYLFATGDDSHGRAVYKYNTLTNTYVSRAVLSYNFVGGSAVAVGTDIYLFGSGNSTYSTYAYKYNTLTNTYTQLTNIPYSFYRGSAVAVGTDVYLFGGEPNKQKVQVMTMQPNIYTDESIVIANNKANRYETILVQTEVINGLKYKFDDVFYYKDEEFDVTIPTYYGNGTEWLQIR